MGKTESGAEVLRGRPPASLACSSLLSHQLTLPPHLFVSLPPSTLSRSSAPSSPHPQPTMSHFDLSLRLDCNSTMAALVDAATQLHTPHEKFTEHDVYSAAYCQFSSNSTLAEEAKKLWIKSSSYGCRAPSSRLPSPSTLTLCSSDRPTLSRFRRLRHRRFWCGPPRSSLPTRPVPSLVVHRSRARYCAADLRVVRAVPRRRRHSDWVRFFPFPPLPSCPVLKPSVQLRDPARRPHYRADVLLRCSLCVSFSCSSALGTDFLSSVPPDTLFSLTAAAESPALLPGLKPRTYMWLFVVIDFVTLGTSTPFPPFRLSS